MHDPGAQLEVKCCNLDHKGDRPEIKAPPEQQKGLPDKSSPFAAINNWDRDPKPFPAFTVDVAEHAVCYSIFQFDTNARRQHQIDTFAFLPELIESAGPKSAVYQAMRACGTVNLANRAGPVRLSQETTSEYARAITSVNAALQHPHERLKDETLIAVWLLGIREVGEFPVLSPSVRQ